MKKSIGLIMMLLVVFLTGCGGATSASSAASTQQAAGAAAPAKEAAAAPDELLKSLDGSKQVQLLELSREKPVYVNFWASWCPPCVKEMPHIEKLYQKYGDRMNFAAVSVDEKLSDAEAFTAKSKLTVPVYTGDLKKLGRDYNLEAIPVSIIIRDGKVIARTVGGMDEAGLEKFLAQGLK